MNPTTRRTFLQQSTGAMAGAALIPTLGALGRPLQLNAPINIGLIGVGRHGRAILAELSKIEGANVVAICDTNDRRLRAGERRARGAKTYASHTEMLSSESSMDAVIVATPTHLHRQVAIDAIEAGKHVYCEAPLAHTIEDARAIATAARGSSKVFQTGMLGRANPVYQLAYSFARSGSIRDVVTMRGQYHRKTTWRVPSSDPAREREVNWRLDPEVSIGLAGEMGTQQFDVFHWFFDDYPVKVSGRGAVLAYDDGREIADTISCTLHFKDGVVLNYDATVANSYEGQYELIQGTMGTFKLGWSHGWLFKESDAPTQGWEVYANRQQFHDEEGITLIADATKLASQGKLKDGVGLPHPAVYYGLETFCKSVTDGEPVVCSASEGLRAAAVGILANEAVVNGTTVDIDPSLIKDA